jgi:hypothetical protein
MNLILAESRSQHDAILQDVQKGRPARPQRAKTRGVPSGYVEGLIDARTPLAAFFSILLYELALSPMIPRTINASEINRGRAVDSANNVIPNMAVPTAPIPVHTA